MWSRFKVLKTLWYENLSNNHNQENMILHSKKYCTGHKKIEKKIWNEKETRCWRNTVDTHDSMATVWIKRVTATTFTLSYKIVTKSFCCNTINNAWTFEGQENCSLLFSPERQNKKQPGVSIIDLQRWDKITEYHHTQENTQPHWGAN